MTHGLICPKYAHTCTHTHMLRLIEAFITVIMQKKIPLELIILWTCFVTSADNGVNQEFIVLPNRCKFSKISPRGSCWLLFLSLSKNSLPFWEMFNFHVLMFPYYGNKNSLPSQSLLDQNLFLRYYSYFYARGEGKIFLNSGEEPIFVLSKHI